MASELIHWEHQRCLSFACVLEAYLVRRTGGRRESWLVREAAETQSLVQITPVPFCPRCGEDLVAAPEQGGAGEQAAA